MYSVGEIQVSAISRFFSATLVKELVGRRRSPLFSRLLTESGLIKFLEPKDTVGSAFDWAFEILKNKAHRHEYIYKSAIAHKILLGKHSLRTASMMTEFRVGKAKADAVILNGTGTAYEIKSERDTLSRLENQMDEFRKVFACVNVVVGENHLARVQELAPDDVGIMVLSCRHSIQTIREAQTIPERTDPSAILEAITIKEAEMMLGDLKIDPPRVPNTIRYRALDEVFRSIPADVAHRQMVTTLKKTRRQAHLEGSLEALPAVVRPLALTSRLQENEMNVLAEAMSTPIETAKEWRYA